MLFNSYSFLLFFPVVVSIYFAIPKKARYIWLLFASYYFYMSWNPKYALLLALSTVVTWVSGLALSAINKKETKSDLGAHGFHGGGSSHCLNKRIVVAVSFVINLGILAFFKYYDFVLNNINVALSVFSIEAFEKPFDLLLPVGISFYTFQALSYTVDVYRGDIEAERNPLKYALFVAFFPQLVAGPIERSVNLLNQVRDVHNMKLWNYERIARGLILMTWGFFLKMVIADRAALLVNEVYNSYWMYGSGELIVATFLFAIQILCDFAGYSIIAIGAAKVMGFSLMENFNAPYFASSIQEFWRRWHISLSTWFRDYLYFPLGGSRCSRTKHYRNIMVVFLVSGLWHGASWNFVIWGFLHGAYQVVGIATRSLRNKAWNVLGVKTEAMSWNLGKILVTFCLVSIAWVFFRASTLTDAMEILQTMLFGWDPWVFFDGTLFALGLSGDELSILVMAIALLFGVDLIRYFKDESIDDFLISQNLWFRWAVVIFLICAVAVFGVYGPQFIPQQFIYFQF